MCEASAFITAEEGALDLADYVRERNVLFPQAGRRNFFCDIETSNAAETILLRVVNANPNSLEQAGLVIGRFSLRTALEYFPCMSEARSDSAVVRRFLGEEYQAGKHCKGLPNMTILSLRTQFPVEASDVLGKTAGDFVPEIQRLDRNC
jgi:hypothetical protein